MQDSSQGNRGWRIAGEASSCSAGIRHVITAFHVPGDTNNMAVRFSLMRQGLKGASASPMSVLGCWNVNNARLFPKRSRHAGDPSRQPGHWVIARNLLGIDYDAAGQWLVAVDRSRSRTSKTRSSALFTWEGRRKPDRASSIHGISRIGISGSSGACLPLQVYGPLPIYSSLDSKKVVRPMAQVSPSGTGQGNKVP